MNKNYNVMIKNADGIKIYRGYRISGWAIKCSNCDFGGWEYEWNDTVKEKVQSHMEQKDHRVCISIEFTTAKET